MSNTYQSGKSSDDYLSALGNGNYKYNKQFFKSGKLNQNIDLGFSFTVDNTIADYATITITKI